MNEEILSHLAIKGRQKQGRVTDAAGERSALVRALRRHKPGPAKGSGKHGATQTRSPVGGRQAHRQGLRMNSESEGPRTSSRL